MAGRHDCWSRRNLLDEIDASILRLLRSRTRWCAHRACRSGPPEGSRRSGRRLMTAASRRQRSSADRWAPRGSRPLVRRHAVMRPINMGLSQRSRGRHSGLPARVQPLYHPAFCRSRRPPSAAIDDPRTLWTAENSTPVRMRLVEMRGLEPLTPSLQRRCSPS